VDLKLIDIDHWMIKKDGMTPRKRPKEKKMKRWGFSFFSTISPLLGLQAFIFVVSLEDFDKTIDGRKYFDVAKERMDRYVRLAYKRNSRCRFFIFLNKSDVFKIKAPNYFNHILTKINS